MGIIISYVFCTRLAATVLTVVASSGTSLLLTTPPSANQSAGAALTFPLHSAPAERAGRMRKSKTAGMTNDAIFSHVTGE